MTIIDKQLEEKLNLAASLLKQAKGIAREQWGNLSDDDKARLIGKKDQVMGKLQRNYGNSWAVRNSNWVLWGTAATLFATALVIFISRKNNA